MSPDQEPDPDLAAELRMTAGQGWNEEAAEDEQLTEKLRRRRMRLGDVVKEFVNRGDRVTVDFGGHSFSGAVVTSGEDFATVQGSGQVAEIRLDTGTWSVLTEGSPTEFQGEKLETFRAVLEQHAASDKNVRFSLPGEDIVIGNISVVATDHIEVADVDGRRIYLPIDMVLAIIRSTDFH